MAPILESYLLAIRFLLKGQGRVHSTVGEGHAGILGTIRKFGFVSELTVNVVYVDLERM